MRALALFALAVAMVSAAPPYRVTCVTTSKQFGDYLGSSYGGIAGD